MKQKLASKLNTGIKRTGTLKKATNKFNEEELVGTISFKLPITIIKQSLATMSEDEVLKMIGTRLLELIMSDSD